MKKGMVVAPQPEAVESGVLVLREGGNAVDAGIASALVQGVVDPQMTGIAGFGSLQVYLPGARVQECIDFHGKSPAAVWPEMNDPARLVSRQRIPRKPAMAATRTAMVRPMTMVSVRRM